MNKAEILNSKINECLKSYTPDTVAKYFDILSEGDGRDRNYWEETHSLDKYPRGMYHYLACATRVIKPNTVVELGADRGVSTLMISEELPPGGKIYSIDVREDGWEYVPENNKNIVKLVGLSTDTELLKDINLSEVKFWFIDGEHTNDMVEQEIKTYSPYWKKGTVVMFDDIDLYTRTWSSIEFDKYESREIHNNNFGVVVV